ncbi:MULTISPECIES: signal peptidase I [Brevibacillus]|jgi:signal peptidase I|uniref:Signal peptidase I n=1 Tax=Brevibacillus borstelensis AK1 TaxID=1300222 RepID=M8DLI5_9BACL|nr:signal peptidase I [Brevibacillus borstelensis]EMT54347.1 signal peptidase I [Brevibacillus borstelensis AK1]KKX54090.1 signal peptidase [Brevibacillus borstelensis cifa_chp40]MBE5398123.1 signal peptidase I [Brevibacillus borstelensis]MCC0564634.1 signal peptidase I [Brevibacillus borstelensis]MCM3470147.1 signal peptidase I [Brevibacillus borstelensis]
MEQIERAAKWKTELLDWVKSFVLIGGLTAFIYVFVMAPYVVQGRSMESTLHDRERVIVNKAIFYLKNPQIGDIVIIHPDASGENWIKRVVALAGDTVEAKNDQLYVNGQPVNEPFLTANKLKAAAEGVTLTEDFGPITVPEGHIFVMGDNRNNSMDSRAIGPVSLDHVVGRAELVYWPLGSIRLPK